jgi:hypothetical protein
MTEKGQEYQTNLVAKVRIGKLLPATQENKEKERDTEGVHRREIVVYVEYRIVCPFVVIGPSTRQQSPPVSECVSPLEPHGGGATIPCG